MIVGFDLDKESKEKFKKYCMEHDIKMGETFTEIVEAWLKKKKV